MFIFMTTSSKSWMQRKSGAKAFMTPLFARVLIKPDDTEDVTKGGIILPGTYKEKSQSGVVVAIGSTVKEVHEAPAAVMVRVMGVSFLPGGLMRCGGRFRKT